MNRFWLQVTRCWLCRWVSLFRVKERLRASLAAPGAVSIAEIRRDFARDQGPESTGSGGFLSFAEASDPQGVW